MMSSKIAMALMPPPNLKISEFADAERYLSPEASSKYGKWETSHVEYLRGILDAICDDEIEEISIMASSQSGKTEIILTIIAYYMKYEPSPIMVVQPTVKPMAEAFSKDRLSTMIRDTPCLKNLVGDFRSKDSNNTILHKTFPGGHITVSGSNSPASLASRPIRILLLDEIDRYGITAEGDPVELAIKRTKTYWNRKIIKVSSPTIKDHSRIEKAFLEGDQRRYFIPCVHCGEFQYLMFSEDTFHFFTDDKGIHYPETTVYVCAKCGSTMNEIDRDEAVKNGIWKPTSKPKTKEKISFHVWSAYAPWTKFKNISYDFLKSKDNRELLQTFVNTELGEPFEEFEREKLESDDLFSRLEDYPHPIPNDVLLLTCGVDCQKDRFELELKGWGINEECFGIQYEIIHGDTDEINGADTWKRLGHFLSSFYTHESGLKLKISCTCIDSGYRTDAVYKFCAKMHRKGVRVYAIKGKGDLGRQIIGRPTMEKKYRIKLFIIGTNAAKDRLRARLNIEKGKPGYMHFPTKGNYDLEYFNQLTAEYKEKRYVKGFPVWEWHNKPGRRNEATDIAVYNFAAVEILKPNFDKIKESFLTKIESGESKKGFVKKQSTYKRQNNWVNSWKN